MDTETREALNRVNQLVAKVQRYARALAAKGDPEWDLGGLEAKLEEALDNPAAERMGFAPKRVTTGWEDDD